MQHKITRLQREITKLLIKEYHKPLSVEETKYLMELEHDISSIRNYTENSATSS